MAKRKIAIIGSGGIGRRHLQSCCGLPTDRYDVLVVDPSAQARAEAQGLIDWHSGPAVQLLSSLSELPTEVDLAVIATCSDTRAKIIQDLASACVVKNLVLEKFLFQRRADYEAVGVLLAREGINAWVNCPIRIWPGYLGLRSWLDGQKIKSFKMSGANWDIGCNAIHYLDLFAFLLGSSNVSVDGVELCSVVPAKRAGMLHLEGVMRGKVVAADGNSVPYVIVSDLAAQAERVVELTTDAGIVRSVEGIDSMSIRFPDGGVKGYPIPFQSQITGGIVAAVLGSGDPGLPTYAVSRKLHEPMLDGFLAALNARDLLDDPDRCPIT